MSQGFNCQLGSVDRQGRSGSFRGVNARQDEAKVVQEMAVEVKTVSKTSSSSRESGLPVGYGKAPDACFDIKFPDRRIG